MDSLHSAPHRNASTSRVASPWDTDIDFRLSIHAVYSCNHFKSNRLTCPSRHAIQLPCYRGAENMPKMNPTVLYCFSHQDGIEAAPATMQRSEPKKTFYLLFLEEDNNEKNLNGNIFYG